MAPIDSSIGLASAIETPIRRRADFAQTPVDSIAARVETVGCDIPSSVCGSVRASIEARIDSVALPIQPLFDPIATPIRVVINSITQILSQGIAAAKDQGRGHP